MKEKTIRLPIYAVLLLVITTACTIPQPEPSSTPLRPTEPRPTITSVPPTQTPRKDVIEFGEVTFDGNECLVSGMTKGPTGKYSIVFINSDSEFALLIVEKMDPGYTWQDVLDYSPPGVYVPSPSWTSSEYALRIERPKGTEHQTEIHTYAFQEIGAYIMVVETSGIWPCGLFSVVNEPSE